MSNLNEDLHTPAFFGDDITVNQALQTWTSLIQVFSSVDGNVQDNANKIAILTSLQNMIATKLVPLQQPAQASMAAVNANTVLPQGATAMMAAVPAPNVTQDSSPVPVIFTGTVPVEDEEEVETPSTEITQPQVIATGDAEKKANDEADPDKKAVVDLTIEDTVTNTNRLVEIAGMIPTQPKTLSEQTKRMLEIAGLR